MDEDWPHHMSRRKQKVLAHQRGVVAITLIVGLGSVACGDGDGGESNPSDSTCSVQLTVGGEVQETITGGDYACAYTFGGDDGIYTSFLVMNGTQIGSVWLDISAVMKDQTGEFPATVTIVLDDERRFTAQDCVVDLLENEPDPGGLEQEGHLDYLVRGTGSCASQAVTPDSDAVIFVGDFQFVTPAVWPE